MKLAAAFIPIKTHSERVPLKNFRNYRGRSLYRWIIDHTLEAQAFDDVYVDTDHEDVAAYARAREAHVIDRDPALATDDANGNDLLAAHRAAYPDYTLYFQIFATAPNLTPASIAGAVETLRRHANPVDGTYDSVLTSTIVRGWHWYAGQPVNFRPGILPRSQDAAPLIRETTGLYGITARALDRYRCRIGARPYFYHVNPDEAVDIDTLADMEPAAHA